MGTTEDTFDSNYKFLVNGYYTLFLVNKNKGKQIPSHCPKV